MKKGIISVIIIGIIFAITGCSSLNTNNNLDPSENALDNRSVEQSSNSAGKAPDSESAEQSSNSVENTPENKHDGQSYEPDYFIKTSGHRPYAVAFHKGIMYMVTAPPSGNGTLWKVTPDGEKHEFAILEGDFKGNYMTDKSFVSLGIDFDKDSNVFITLGDRLLKISPDGITSIIAEGFSRCFDVKLDLNGNMFVADDKEDTIYKINPTMEKSVFYKGEEKGDFVLTSMAFDENYENLYVREGKKILKFNLSSDKVSEEPEVIAENIRIFGICIDSNNNIYASTSSSNIKKIDSNGHVTDIVRYGLIHNSIGLNIGGAEFDTNSLYIADTYGIVKVPLEE